MDDIDLLPWREARRRARLRMLWLTLALGIPAFAALGMSAGRLLYQRRAPLIGQIAEQARLREAAYRQLQQRMAALPAPLRHESGPGASGAPSSDAPVTRLAQQLRLMQATIPDAVWLTRLSHLPPYWLLEGQGVSRQVVADFALRMAAWRWQGLHRAADGRWQFTLRLCATEACRG
ncbi:MULTISPECIES: hypothetical protein [Edwardsiella]|uniref:Type IV pilus biogenesis protein PilN n=2 Tax=Edwardsiella anguillarum TaxID=1821960 RepID=A0A076LQP5_9GAMM|nr:MULTISPECIES: hypothetical protein [Edwardsiella]AIJ07944.1 Hypothetical protein ETEE_1493 [Edwardsiella anguillarum ET080813]AKR79493.2 hypothetical protein AAZ33_17055 [Edwardsiella sp. LADL05-105]UOU79283.1 hypothetical protein MUN71_01255 [Edwardsiella anguillarum]WHP83676.1 hypothetical protein MQ095_18370 [Edwardsiella anguillarum]WHP87466.1 hypothetical protein MQ088_18365 [Edwardsiella anguillarum]